MSTAADETSKETSQARASSDLSRTLLHAAWMSIALGIGIQLILLVVAAGYAKFPATQAVISETVQKVSWSLFVCVGIAVGTAVTKSRPTVMGILGLLAAPVAFHVARILQKTVGTAMGLPGTGMSNYLLFMVTVLKTVEYTCFGAMIGCAATRLGGSLRAYAGTGALIGVIFGTLITVFMAKSVPQTPPQIVARAINEILFPIGCSLVLFTAEKFGKKLPS